MVQERSLTELRGTAGVLRRELSDSARHLLSVIERLEQTAEGTDAYEELEAELAVAATEVRLDAASLERALEAVDDALPDDDEQ